MTGSGHYAIADPRCNACVRLPPVLRKFRSRRFRGDSRPAGAVHRRDGRTAVRRRLQPGSATISIEKIRNRRQTAPSEDGHRTRFGSPDRFRGLVLTISGICRTVGNVGRGVRGRQPAPGEPGDTIRFYIRTPGCGAWRRSRRRAVPGMARSLGALFAGKSTGLLRKVEVSRKPVERNGSQEKAERDRAGQVRQGKINRRRNRAFLPTAAEDAKRVRRYPLDLVLAGEAAKSLSPEARSALSIPRIWRGYPADRQRGRTELLGGTAVVSGSIANFAPLKRSIVAVVGWRPVASIAMTATVAVNGGCAAQRSILNDLPKCISSSIGQRCLANLDVQESLLKTSMQAADARKARYPRQYGVGVPDRKAEKIQTEPVQKAMTGTV